MDKHHILIAAAALCAPLLLSTQAVAEYPERPVHIIVGSAAGGSNDLVPRLIGAKLKDKWAQPVVVENRPSDSNIVGMGIVQQAAPDGYTLLIVNNNYTVTASQLKWDYDPVKSFEPVSLLAGNTEVLVINSTVPARTFKEFVDYAKANPGKLNFGSSGIGDPSRLAMLLLMQRAGLDIVNINYKGGAEAYTAVLSGEINMIYASLANANPMIQDKKITALAVSSAVRHPLIPDVPTTAEAGNLPGFDVTGWIGLLAPAKTPKAIIQKISADMAEVLKAPDIQQNLINRAILPFGTTPEQFGDFIRTDIPQWENILKALDKK